MISRSILVALFIALLCGGCLEREALDRETLMDPAACANCHPDQYREWSGSMHAYAADDPVFVALNAFGQRTTDGALGSLCVGCHAPMAVFTGATTDGLNLDEVPRHLKGVTCFYCHQIDRIEGDHNGALHLADDDVFRGGFGNPMETPAHRSATEPMHDGSTLESSNVCGPCHDVVSPAGVPIEQTFVEWKESIFAQPGPAGISCAGCHMPGRKGKGAELDDAPERRVHDHSMPGIDVALSPWPEVEAQRAGINRDLRASLNSRLCVEPAAGGTDIKVTLDNALIGHSFPSGVTHARRAWVEVVAYSGEDVVMQSGVVADGEPVASLDDPNLWLMRSKLLDENDEEVHVAWAAASIESNLLPPAVTNDPSDPRFNHSVEHTYPLLGDPPTRVTVRVHMRPLGLDMFADLIESGDLDPAVLDEIPTFTLDAISREWIDTDGFGCVD